MMTIIKIIHYQVALPLDVMDNLKNVTGQRTALGALTEAVEFTISRKGGDGD